MYQVCYSLPVALHTPAVLVICVLLSQFVDGVDDTVNTALLSNIGNISYNWILALVPAWLSQLWISRHLWCPNNIRLELIEQ